MGLNPNGIQASQILPEDDINKPAAWLRPGS